MEGELKNEVVDVMREWGECWKRHLFDNEFVLKEKKTLFILIIKSGYGRKKVK